MNARDTLSILSSQSGGRGHGIAGMSSNHFLVSFQSAVLMLAMRSNAQRLKTDAPPELSEPAMISIRLLSMLIKLILMVSLHIFPARWIDRGHARRVEWCRKDKKESERYSLNLVRHWPNRLSAGASLRLRLASRNFGISCSASPMKRENNSAQDKAFHFTGHCAGAASTHRWLTSIPIFSTRDCIKSQTDRHRGLPRFLTATLAFTRLGTMKLRRFAYS